MGYMIEIYLLIAVISNVIADILIWGEVNKMKDTITEANGGFQEFAQTLGITLGDHAKATAKAIGGVIGHYQGKAEKAAASEVEGLQGTLQALGPLADLISKAPSSSGSGETGKFHM